MTGQYEVDMERELSDDGGESVTRTVTCTKCGTRWRVTFYVPEGARDWEVVSCPECSAGVTIRV